MVPERDATATPSASTATLLDDAEHVLSYGGTSQYNRDGTGASVCGLTAPNFARIVSSATAASPESDTVAIPVSTSQRSFAPQAPVKHAKGLAVVGTGLTDKYIANMYLIRSNLQLL